MPAPGNYTTVSCTAGTWDAATRTIRANAFTTRLGDDLKGSYLDEYTAGLEIAFNRDYSMRVNVVRKFDFPGTKTFNMAEPFNAFTDVRTYPDPGPDGVNNTPDDTGRNLPPIFVWSVPRSYPTQGQTDDLIANLRDGEGKDQFTAYEVTFSKQYSQKWSALAGYTVDMAHENSNDPLNPNDLLYQYDEAYWRQAVKMNGQYEFPGGFMWAGTFTAQSGEWFDRTVQQRNALNSNVTVTAERRVGRYPWVQLWDNRISKRFQINERHSIEAVFDLFNTLNVNTITEWRVASGSTYHLPSAIIAARVFKLGVKYRF